MRRAIYILCAIPALGAVACTTDGYGPPAYQGSQWNQPRQPFPGELIGPGVALLDPWLAQTPEGRAIVTVGFSAAARGYISEEVAHRANIWFRRYADQDRDLRITDGEIRNALVAAAAPYLDPSASPVA